MKYFTILLLALILLSCRQKEPNSVNTKIDTTTIDMATNAPATKLDSIRNEINRLDKNTKDSVTYVFSLEESHLSLEGNEGKAFYFSGKLQKIEIVFFGETGKSITTYTFLNEIVNVNEKRFSYNGSLTDVKGEDDIKLAEETQYRLDLKGKLIDGNADKSSDETFLLLMSSIPLSL
ncbi:MAG: hypothetical protein EOO07_28410 [Chitinophagaceae bacterium]|nr:MAG: hypothetical protein EOO07_28410 [Chitinophagaceae bacterium]